MSETGMSNRLSSLSGILSPIVLAGTAAFVGAQRPEYSHIREALSELGAIGRPYASLMNLAGIVPSGVLTMLAAPSAYRTFGESRLSRAAEIVLALAGATLVGTALFAWAGAPTDLSSTNNKVHLALALSGFFCLALAPLLFGLHAWAVAKHRIRSVYSIATALGVFLLGFVFARPPYLGIFQRGALAVFFAWLIAISLQGLIPRDTRK